jgi:hypothetical protein
MERIAIVAVALGALLFAGAAQEGVAADALCKQKKAKATGKKASDILKAFGKNVKKSNADKLAADVSKAESKFTKAFTKAESSGTCATSGDSGAIEDKVNALAAQVIEDVGPTCGNNLRGDTEECDGTDDTACPGVCQPDCACAICGDNAVNLPDEECDGADAPDCQGICQPNCRCPEPRCGNGVLEAGELCEPPCSQGPCGAGQICGVTCACVPAAPCDCGTPDPPTTLAFESEVQGGICGVIKDAGDVTLVDLQCAKTYVGGGILGAAPQATPVPVGRNLYKVECCYGTTLALTSYGAAQTGSIRNCTSAGCIFGAPIPVTLDPVVLSDCTWDEIVADAFGSADCSTGEAAINFPVYAPVHLTGDMLGNRCSGGPNPGGWCTEDSDCPGATCIADPVVQPCPICNPTTLKCNGGPNNGLACTPGTPEISPEYPTSHDCPPPPHLQITFSLQHFSLTTGTASALAADGQFCGFCRDINIEGSACFEGDPDPGGARNCPDSAIIACEPQSGGDVGECGTPVPCTSAADCYAPYESCEQRDAGAAGQSTATAIVEIGSPGGNLSDRLQHSATLVSVHCAPPTLDQLTDSTADFPGPGATAIPGKLQLLP